MRSGPRQRRRVWPPMAALVILAALTTALPVAGAPASTGLTVQAGAVGKRALDFTVRTVDGKTFRLSAQRGKVVVFDFLVPGCGECEVEAPWLGTAARMFGPRGAKVLILDVSGLGDADLRRFYRPYRLEKALIARDNGFRVARKYRVTSLGTTVVVGRDGTITWRGSWVGDEDRLLNAIRSALA